MNKLPVWSTIRFAYAFTIGDIGTIIGLIWLPTLLIGVLQFLPYEVGTRLSDASSSTAAAASFLNFLFLFATLLLYAMNAVAVLRQALGLRKGPASLYFSVGLGEWRMLGANVLCALILGALVLGYFAGFLVVSSLFKSDAVGDGVMLAYAVIGGCLLVYIGLRLVFLVAPIVVTEDKVDFVRSWTLSSRNLLRILAVVAAVSLPLLAIQTVATILIGGPGLLAPLPADQHAMEAALNLRLALLDKHMPELIGLFLILAPFNFGLTFGAEAAAYRALVPPRTLPG